MYIFIIYINIYMMYMYIFIYEIYIYIYIYLPLPPRDAPGSLSQDTATGTSPTWRLASRKWLRHDVQNYISFHKIMQNFNIIFEEIPLLHRIYKISQFLQIVRNFSKILQCFTFFCKMVHECFMYFTTFCNRKHLTIFDKLLQNLFCKDFPKSYQNIDIIYIYIYIMYILYI